jgi:hypothetical protein
LEEASFFLLFSDGDYKDNMNITQENITLELK